ncbi:MAG: glycoside hydrolase family 57 [Candidatus Omnitrophica bacterium]|nr:glycoside hydrolase family 57 [Candidatus Omnitrophota bacterium]
MSAKNKIYYGMGLHMHQPPGNLKLLIEHNRWEAQQIIKCYDRAARYALKYPQAPFHVDFSGILLEQFLDQNIIDAYKEYVDIPQMLDNYRKAKNIEIIGMGYYHPIFPLIPQDDWSEHLQKGRAIFEKIFGQSPKGFWPSEMAFCMEMIPALKKAGYEYVVVDHVHVHNAKEGQPVDPFKLYKASFGGSEIVIVPRNRDMSNAQESGLNPAWFLKESKHKVASGFVSSEDRLLVTWSDGENGGWFRQIDENAGFFGYFWEPLVQKVLLKETDITLVKLGEYIKKNPPKDCATVRTGAWNVGSTTGFDFGQWNGSESQKRALGYLYQVDTWYWEKQKKLGDVHNENLENARACILDAETSCYLFWGEMWLPKIYERLDSAKRLLERV